MSARLASLLLLAMTLAVGCDIVDEPVAPRTGGPGGVPDSTATYRRILMEEFTGHRCGTCPAAHAEARRLKARYGDTLVLVNVHATSFFAAPLSPPAPDGRYSTDFRTPAGETFVSSFGVNFIPAAMVDRRPYNGSRALAEAAWGAALAAAIGRSPAVDARFTALRYDAANGTLDAEVEVVVLEALTGDHNLTIYLVEDHVTDWQLNAQMSPPDVPDYDHRHVLRAVNDTWGVPLVIGSADVGDTLALSSSRFSLAPGWAPANCSLVAFVYHTASEEVVQVVERRILP